MFDNNAIPHQTPAKHRFVSQDLSRRSIEAELEMDLNESLSRGIHLEDLIKIAYKFSDESYQEYKKEASSWIAPSQDKDNFDDILSEYTETLKEGVMEDELYESFAAACNFVLQKAMKDYNVPAEKRIKLIVTNDTMIEGLKPDFCIVPENVETPKSVESSSPNGPIQPSESTPAPAPPTMHPVGSPPTNNANAALSNTTTAATSEPNSDDIGTISASPSAGDPIAVDVPSQPSISNVNTAENVATAEVNSTSAADVDAGTYKDNIKWHQVLAPVEMKKTFKMTPENPTDTASKFARIPTSVDVSASRGSSMMETDDVFSGQSQSAAGDTKGPRKRPLNHLEKAEKDKENLATRKQTVNYAARALSKHGDRIFAVVPVVDVRAVSMSFYSREGIVESRSVNFVKDKVILAVVLGLFVKFSSDLPRLGFDDKMGYINPFNPDDADTRRPTLEIRPITKADGGNTQDEQPDLTGIQLREQIMSQFCVVGRGTSVSRVKLEYRHKLVAKCSWQVKGRRWEHEIIKAARQVDPVHTPEIFGYFVDESDADSILENLRNACSLKSEKFERRELRVLIIREYTTISDLGVDESFLDAISQIMICLHNLNKKQIRHRDVSIYNIMYYLDEDGRIIAVLIDFDLATMPPFDKDPTSSHRTGTAPFMAWELLSRPGCQQGLHHDLESCIHCVVWHGAGYRTDRRFPRNTRRRKQPIAKDVLRGWRVGKWNEIALAKYGFYTGGCGGKAVYLQKLKEDYPVYGRMCALLVGVLSDVLHAIDMRENAAARLADVMSKDCTVVPPVVAHGTDHRLTYAGLMFFFNRRVVCEDDCCRVSAV